jgi:hypothetical protein
MKRKSSLILPLLTAAMFLAAFMGSVKTTCFAFRSYSDSYEKKDNATNAIVAKASPWLYVDPASITLEPDPCLGKTFNIGVGITGPPPLGLDAAWNTIAASFKLFFDDTLIDPITINEGPFFQDPAWNKYGTFFIPSYEVDAPASPILVGFIILPNSSGFWDQTSFPNGTGIIANITFKVIKQSLIPLECNLTLEYSHGESLLDKDGNPIPMDEPAHGHYNILPTPITAAKIHVAPEALDLNIKRENLAVFIQLPEGYDPNNVIISSTTLNNTFYPIGAGTIGNHTRACTLNHTNLDLMLTFNRTAISECLLSQHITCGNVTLTTVGQLNDGTQFKGQVEIGIRTRLGDANCDHKVDMKDCYMVAAAFGESPSRARWNGFADLDENEKIDLKDYYATAVNFGKP